MKRKKALEKLRSRLLKMKTKIIMYETVHDLKSPILNEIIVDDFYKIFDILDKLTEPKQADGQKSEQDFGLKSPILLDYNPMHVNLYNVSCAEFDVPPIVLETREYGNTYVWHVIYRDVDGNWTEISKGYSEKVNAIASIRERLDKKR